MSEEIEELYLNKRIVDSDFYERYFGAMALYTYLVFDSYEGLVKQSLDAIAKRVRMKPGEARELLIGLLNYGFIEMYKNPLWKGHFIIAVRKNEYAWFEEEEAFPDYDLFRFKTGGRREEGYSKWRNQCLKRDNFTCQRCGSTEDLHVHHIKPYKSFPELRTEISNGITLCQSCHKEIHKEMRESDMDG